MTTPSSAPASAPSWRRRLDRARDVSVAAGTALRENVTGGSDRRRRFAHDLARGPVEFAAAELLRALPVVELADLVDLTAVPDLPARTAWGGRGAWSLGPTERAALVALVAGRGVRDAFEIGTYDGGTTAVLAEHVGPDGRVVTLDLPPGAFDATQAPPDLAGGGVGHRWRASPFASRVEQVLQDSLTFDPAPWAGRFDLVLVDGAHDHVHGVADSRTALTLARPGGIVVWDDITAYWVGLVRGVVEAVGDAGFSRLAGTDLGVLVVPDAP